MVIGNKYNVNGTEMTFRWAQYSVGNRCMMYFFTSGYFTHTLRENELELMVKR